MFTYLLMAEIAEIATVKYEYEKKLKENNQVSIIESIFSVCREIKAT